MRRPSSAIGLVVAFIVGVGIVLLLNSGGDDKNPATVAGTTPTTATVPGILTTTPTTPTKTTKTTKTTASKPTKTKGRTTTAPPTRTQTTPPHLETSPQELAKRAKQAAAKAKQGGATTCPDLKSPAEAQNITVLHVSCKTAKLVIFASTPAAKRGFVCDIVNESFSDVPAVEYACNRKADKAKLGYTAVG
jgi:cytoskeletal protein RodZ